MNFMEMIMALFAIVFFTTVSLIYNRSMWYQAENLDNVGKVIQATQLAHSKLDQIDAELLSQQLAFSEQQLNNTPPTVQQAYDGVTTTNVLDYAGYTFTATYNFDYCDSLGLNPSDTYNPAAKFIKVTVTIASTPGMSHQVAISRVYTKTNFYLDY
jgi:hypothetical protein